MFDPDETLINRDNVMLDEFDTSKRKKPARLVVIHTTGSGIVQRVLDRSSDIIDRSIRKAVRDPEVFKELDRRMGQYGARYFSRHNNVSSHFLISWSGEVYQTCDVDLVAWSAGMKTKRYEAYLKGWDHWTQFTWKGNALKTHGLGRDMAYGWWESEMADMGMTGDISPLDLFDGRYINDEAISIDLIPAPWKTRVTALDNLRVGGPKEGPWFGHLYTHQQMQSLCTLLDMINTKTGVPITRRTVVPHSMLDPMARIHLLKQPPSNVRIGYGYDPGYLPWWTLLSEPEYPMLEDGEPIYGILS